MPGVEVPTSGSGRDHEATPTQTAPVYGEHAHTDGSAPSAPARSVRRATARRASTRRATARRHHGDTEASIIDFLEQHPGSTAGDLARALNLDPGIVSPKLTQLAKAGEIRKSSHGYRTDQAART